MNKLPFLLLLLVLSACAVSYYLPRAEEGVTVEDRFAIVRTDSLLIAVRPQAYHNSTNSLAGRYFCLYVHVRNFSTATRRISHQSFSILANDRQFDYIPLNLVVGNNNLLSRDPFELMNPTLDQQTLLDREDLNREKTLDLINSYFSFGDILAGSRKEGYLFYNRDLLKARTILVDALGCRLRFDYGKLRY